MTDISIYFDRKQRHYYALLPGDPNPRPLNWNDVEDVISVIQRHSIQPGSGDARREKRLRRIK